LGAVLMALGLAHLFMRMESTPVETIVSVKTTVVEVTL
jgi:hypothetical protein